MFLQFSIGLTLVAIINGYERLRPIEVTNNHYNTFPTDPYAPEENPNPPINQNGIYQPYSSAEAPPPFEVETDELPPVEEDTFPMAPRNRFRPSIRRSENNIFRRIAPPYTNSYGSSRALPWREIDNALPEENFKPFERNPWLNWKSHPRMWRIGRGNGQFMLRHARRPPNPPGCKSFLRSIFFPRTPNFAQNIATNHWNSPNRFTRSEWPLAEK